MNKDEKKVFKTIHDMNQEAKNIFGDTFIIHRDKLYCDPYDVNTSTQIGRHMGFLEKPIYDGYDYDTPLIFHSRNFYRLQKSFKKYIDKLNICEDTGCMSVTMTNDCPNMTVVEKKMPVNVTNIITSPYLGDIVPYERGINLNDYKSLSEDEVTKLVQNKYLDLIGGGVRVRITKSLIPNLKEKYVVYYKFEKCDDDGMGFVMFYVIRDTLISLHKYRFCNIYTI